ncbi:hypothetical protein D3C75_1144070 [compost metagenome]
MADLLRRHAGALDGGAGHCRGQVSQRQVFEGAAKRADGRTDGADYVDFRGVHDRLQYAKAWRGGGSL